MRNQKRVEYELVELKHSVELIKEIMLVREPATIHTADAYEGLRKQVIAGAAERTAHLSQLARLDAEAHRGASVEDIQLLLRDLLAEAGLQRMTSVARGQETAFDVVGGDGDGWEVLEPAYYEDTGRGQVRLVRIGKAERVASPSTAPAPEHEPVDVMQEAGR